MHMPKATKRGKKLGRPQGTGTEDLLARYKALKRFLEDNDGRIGLRLRRVRRPDDVRAILRVIPGVEWFPPFRDHPARCFLEEGSGNIALRQLRKTQRKHEEAIAEESRCFSELQSIDTKVYEARAALNSLICRYPEATCLVHFLRAVFAISKALKVKELADSAALAAVRLGEARERELRFRHQRASEEGRYARGEIVKFVRSRRYAKNPVNFASAMAGLPEYSWIHSFRKCPHPPIDPEYPATFNYQLLQTLGAVVKKVRPRTMKNIATALREEFLKRPAGDLLRVHFGPKWVDIEQGIASCIGVRCKRSELAYVLMAKIQDNLERGKSTLEMELAKRWQLP